jgi:hypothetical protein
MPVQQMKRKPLVVQESMDQQQKLEMKLPVRKVTQLPSKFLPYQPAVQISFVPYTFGELLNFSQSSLSKVDSMEFMLKGIYTSGMNKYDLAFFDFIYIALLRKISSYKEDELLIQYICTNCGEKNIISGRLTELKFHDLNVPALPLIIKDDEGNDLQFMPITVKTYLELSRQDKMGDQLEIFASTVINMPKAKVKTILSNASGEFLRAINYMNEVLEFGLEDIKFNCKECKTVNTLGMEDPEIYISPFSGYDGLIGDRIQFGLQEVSTNK